MDRARGAWNGWDMLKHAGNAEKGRFAGGMFLLASEVSGDYGSPP